MASSITVASDEHQAMKLCLQRKLEAEKKTINRYVIETYGPSVVETIRLNVREICAACKYDYRSWNWTDRQKAAPHHICNLCPAHIVMDECEQVLQLSVWTVRQHDTMDTGTALGKCAKEKLYRGYIDLELQLREFDRCRTLYEKFLQFAPENCTTWIKFAELETLLGDVDRARAIYELAVQQPALDMPEILWKSFVDFEIGQEEYENARALYRRLIQRTRHVKVWLSYATFELSTEAEEGVAAINRARTIFRKANRAMAEAEDSREERLLLLEHWMNFEREHGDDESLASVEKELPKRVKKRRQIHTQDGSEGGWEEYYDYIFPSDQGNQASLKLLELAKKWKQKKDPADEEMDDGKAAENVEGGDGETDKNVDDDKKEIDKEQSSDCEPEPDKVREGDSDTDLDDSD